MNTLTYEERKQSIIFKNNIRKEEIYKEIEKLNDILRNNGYINRIKENKQDKEVKEKIRDLARELDFFRNFENNIHLFHLENFE